MKVARRIPQDDLLPRVLATYGIHDQPSDDARSRFISRHIADLEASPNEAISRRGYVLKRANEGFGLGYKVPLGVIAAGQVMLGIDLAVAAPFLASNPAAFTTAAMGAIYYGYQALDDQEREELHRQIGAALDFGAELVKTLIRFVIDMMSSLLDSQALAQVKDYLAQTAATLGLTLYDITGRMYDRITGLAAGVGSAAASVGETAGTALARGKELLWRADHKD
ncbi:hypothetical protein [Alteraurantiacibacter buctensis]|uniref:EcsC family protein n=1 Tax=Alteraurantiacibacter buctensis TaxID=1503981 RepID=A0A844YZG7_9SPHN|nr:hypothetical protein [Alteraurantiacibacter buctensis]MXO72582.1 hypothetical protein [Alteraurantiacibacter buctensis]